MGGPMAVLLRRKEPHANRSGTCCNEERRVGLRLLDADGGASPRIYLRLHRGRPLRAQCRDQILQQGKFGSDDRMQHRRWIRAVSDLTSEVDETRVSDAPAKCFGKASRDRGSPW